MTRTSRRIFVRIAAILVAFGSLSISASELGTAFVRGSATYRERIALPPGAVLEVSLEDVSVADAPAKEVGSVRTENPGNPPFHFEIPYDPILINKSHSYSVRATIRVDGQLMFTTDTSYPVLTRGAGTEIELLLRRVPGKKKAPAQPPLGQLPASFEGELPCADCPGVFYHLDLFEDRVFFLRTTYLGRAVGAVFDSIGSWVFDSRERRIILFGSSESAIYFRVVDSDTLRKLDVEGRSIESELDYDLKRKEDADRIEPRLMMRGMYRYMADAAIFEECSSGRQFQVAQEADNVALERAYLEVRREPGESIIVSFQGRVTERPAMEGDGMVLTVVPERFIGIRPGETCGARGSFSEIKDNRWKLTRLGDAPVVLSQDQREPHLVLRSKDRRVTGTGGCNSFSGSYEIVGDTIKFGALAATMMACPEGGDFDLALISALEKAKTFQKTAHHLELYDSTGKLLARFEARELQ